VQPDSLYFVDLQIRRVRAGLILDMELSVRGRKPFPPSGDISMSDSHLIRDLEEASPPLPGNVKDALSSPSRVQSFLTAALLILAILYTFHFAADFRLRLWDRPHRNSLVHPI
jgi:hypothetical protein